MTNKTVFAISEKDKGNGQSFINYIKINFPNTRVFDMLEFTYIQVPRVEYVRALEMGREYFADKKGTELELKNSFELNAWGNNVDFGSLTLCFMELNAQKIRCLSRTRDDFMNTCDDFNEGKFGTDLEFANGIFDIIANKLSIKKEDLYFYPLDDYGLEIISKNNFDSEKNVKIKQDMNKSIETGELEKDLSSINIIQSITPSTMYGKPLTDKRQIFNGSTTEEVTAKDLCY